MQPLEDCLNNDLLSLSGVIMCHLGECITDLKQTEQLELARRHCNILYVEQPVTWLSEISFEQYSR